MGSFQSILVIGPTGSGKTPLGNYCEETGLWGRRCVHFDFGDQLRKIADNGCASSFLSEHDLDVIVESLKTGALLESENFHIARKILQRFTDEKKLKDSDILLLNGMPRHEGQAIDMNGLVEMTLVLNLTCEPEVVHQRISLNSGGDRTERIDDTIEEIEKKIGIYNTRTSPLLDYFRREGIMVEAIQVGVETSVQDMHRSLDRLSFDF